MMIDISRLHGPSNTSKSGRRRGPRPKVSAALLPQLIAAYVDDGRSIQFLAKRHRIAPSTVWKWLKRAGVERRPAGNRKAPLRRDAS